MSHEVEGDELAQDMIDERNATSELDPLLEKILEIESDACWYQQSDGQCDDMHSVIRALEAVLAIPEEIYLPTSSKGYFHSGRNSMRGEVRSAIAEALGVEL